jgi:MFS family permease
MIKKIFKEQKTKFDVFTPSAKKLIWSNLLFGLFNPFYLIFSNTFIFNTTKGDLKFNLLYCIFTFIGIITGFAVNGILIRRFHIKNQLVFGELLLFVALTFMFFIPSKFLTGIGISIFGLSTGIGNGIYWSSRNYLTIVNTHDSNRDFFSGLDYILISSGRIITPFFIGMYIGEGIEHGWFTSRFAYKSTLIFAFLAVIFSSFFLLKGYFNSAQTKKFFYVKYSGFWIRARLMSILLGFFQGAIFVIPPVFIMKYIGNEATVGTLSSISYLLAIIIVYIVSSRSKVEHRTGIMTAGSFIFFTGSIFFAAFNVYGSVIATSVLTFLMFMTEPIISFPFRATIMKAIDDLKHIEKRDDYSYLFDVEMSTAVGRVTSIGFFYLLYILLPINLALSLYLVLVALLQFFIMPLSKKINGR